MVDRTDDRWDPGTGSDVVSGFPEPWRPDPTSRRNEWNTRPEVNAATASLYRDPQGRRSGQSCLGPQLRRAS